MLTLGKIAATLGVIGVIAVRARSQPQLGTAITIVTTIITTTLIIPTTITVTTGITGISAQ